MEHVRPLLEEELSQCNADELCLGLHSVAQGLSFLHDKVSLLGPRLYLRHEPPDFARLRSVLLHTAT